MLFPFTTVLFLGVLSAWLISCAWVQQNVVPIAERAVSEEDFRKLGTGGPMRQIRSSVFLVLSPEQARRRTASALPDMRPQLERKYYLACQFVYYGFWATVGMALLAVFSGFLFGV